MLLGETRLEGELARKLAGYVARGGHLVACANQLAPEAEALFGAQVGPVEEAYHAIVPGHPWPISESRFRMHRLQPEAGTEILAHTRQGAPLVVRKTHPGGGVTLLFAAEYFLANPTLEPEHIYNKVDQPLPSPYPLLEHVRAVLLPYLRGFSLVTIEGPPIQFLVNVTSRTDRLVVTLCNNDPEPWEGRIVPKRGKVRSAMNWMDNPHLPGGDAVTVQVPPLDVVVIELLLDRPAFVEKKS
jgi:hypothetical protein